MGKRLNSVGNMKTPRSHKTAKRLEAKEAMLAVARTRRNSRHFNRKAKLAA